MGVARRWEEWWKRRRLAGLWHAVMARRKPVRVRSMGASIADERVEGDGPSIFWLCEALGARMFEDAKNRR